MKKIARLFLPVFCVLCAFPAMAQDSGPSFQLETKVVAIPEETWKKLCKDNPAFTDYAASFPDLAQPKPAYADFAKKIAEPEKGVWEIPTGTIREFPALTAGEFASLLTALEKTEGVESLSVPAAGYRGRAIAEITREIHFATEFQDNKDAPPKETKNEDGQTVMAKPSRFTPTAFVTKNPGFSLDASVTKGKDGAIDLDLAPSFVSWVGYYTDDHQGHKTFDRKPKESPESTWPPAFAVTRGKMTVSVKSGEVIMLGGIHINCASKALDQDHMLEYDSQETVRRVLLIFITCKLEH